MRAAVLIFLLAGPVLGGGACDCRVAPAGGAVSAASDGAGGGAPIALSELAVPGAAKIDGLKLLETGHPTPTLLFSTQVCRAPRVGIDDCRMEIHSVAIGDPARVAAVASIPRPLPPPPRWDARAREGGGFEILLEEAGGALYRLLLDDPSGTPSSPSAAHPFQSLGRPRFVRATGGAAARAATATVGGTALVVFADVHAKPPAKFVPLADAPDGVAGVSAAGAWVVSRSREGGAAMFNELPGRLAFTRMSRLDAAAASPPVAFPGFLAYELDAAALGSDVIVFATGQPAMLLRASRPARAIALSAPERPWLSRLSRPTISVGGGRVRIAALANPGTDAARVLYGDIPASALDRP